MSENVNIIMVTYLVWTIWFEWLEINDIFAGGFLWRLTGENIKYEIFYKIAHKGGGQRGEASILDYEATT